MSQNVTIIIGGQYGSEGKGKVAGYLAPEFDIAVRVGGPNAGHTVCLGSKTYKFRQLPVASIVNNDCTLCIGAGGIIDMKVLEEEMARVPNITERLIIDRNALILEQQDINHESSDGLSLFSKIGSTGKGVGSALARKVMRTGCRVASDVEELKKYVGNVQDLILSQPDKSVMLEGTQGYALSLNHGPFPYCTSRDVLATSLLSDVGLPYNCVKDVIMVIRTYPIRVFGNSGPMFEEINWQTVSNEAGSPVMIMERTTVTNRVRRVGRFDWELLAAATAANAPTQIALMFVDYLNYVKNYGVRELSELSPEAREFIEQVEDETGVDVTLIGTGEQYEHMIEVHKQEE